MRKIDILTALEEAEPKYSKYATKRIDGDKSIHNMLYETACDMYNRCRHAVERAGNKVYEWVRLGADAMVCGQCGKGLNDEHGYGFVLYEFDYCPFCGGTVRLRCLHIAMIECLICRAIMSFGGKETPDKTIKAYNMRAESGDTE